jgi:hypothetical protein
MTVKQVETALYDEKNQGNLIQASVGWSHDVGWGNDVCSGSISRASTLWSDWINTSGASGEEPPQWIKDAVEIDAKKWQAVAGPMNTTSILKKAWSGPDNLAWINFVSIPHPLIVNNRRMPVAVTPL